MHKLQVITDKLINDKTISNLTLLSVLSMPFLDRSAQGSYTLLAIVSLLVMTQLLFKKSFQIYPLTLLYLALITLLTLSSFQTANFLESFISPETPYLYLGIISIYFLSTKSTPNIKRLLQIIAALLIFDALAFLVQALLTRFGLNPPYIPRLTGSPTDWVYLCIILSVSIYFLFEKQKLLIIPLVLLGFTQVAALREQNLGLSLQNSYTYLIDELKTPQRLLLGTSPSRFSVFFGRHFDGIETDIGSVPQYSQSLILTMISTLGVLGTLSVVSIYVYIYKSITNNIDLNTKVSKYIKIIYPVTALASLFLPLSANSIIAFHIITIYVTTHLKVSRIDLPKKALKLPNKKIITITLNTAKVLLISPFLFLFYWQVRSTIADYYLYQYNGQAKNSQSLYAYNSIRTAIGTYPYRAELHTQYSLVNLVLADKLTSEGISETQDQSNILGLYQQAIREATTATTLESSNYLYWKNLGIIYRELISLASNSYTYSEAAYTNAIKIAPQNPSLWLDLGVVYFKAGLFDRSCEVTSKALELKSDWYQAHANLGLCLNKLGQASLAKTHLETALSLTQPGTPEYQKISDDLKKFN